MSGAKTPTPTDRTGGLPGGGRGEPAPGPLRTCPNCGAALDERSCKLVCLTPGCGYFLSCSDYL